MREASGVRGYVACLFHHRRRKVEAEQVLRRDAVRAQEELLLDLVKVRVRFKVRVRVRIRARAEARARVRARVGVRVRVRARVRSCSLTSPVPQPIDRTVTSSGALTNRSKKKLMYPACVTEVENPSTVRLRTARE